MATDSFPYRDQLRRNLARQTDRYTLAVDLVKNPTSNLPPVAARFQRSSLTDCLWLQEDLASFKEETAAQLRESPDEIMPLFEEAAREFYYTFLQAEDAETLANLASKPHIQLRKFTRHHSWLIQAPECLGDLSSQNAA